MEYFVKGACWSTLPNESHDPENCVDMTYAVYDKYGTIIPAFGMFVTRDEANEAVARFAASGLS